MNRRINKIIGHLEGSKLSLESTLSRAELANPDFMAELSLHLRENKFTGKWEKYDGTTQLQSPL